MVYIQIISEKIEIYLVVNICLLLSCGKLSLATERVVTLGDIVA